MVAQRVDRLGRQNLVFPDLKLSANQHTAKPATRNLPERFGPDSGKEPKGTSARPWKEASLILRTKVWLFPT